jgi:2-amino-4-hydroxy-6-hydroxymethyldihydropteridine diphosphokinase
VRDAVTAYLALGANLGDAQATVREAMDAIDTLPATRVVRRSSLYRTAPMESNGPDYINAVVQVETALTAPDLLRELQALELRAGRLRPYRNAPRTLDLDILLFGEARIFSDALTIPHPRMDLRAFVLVPLGEIAPQLVDAVALRAVAGQDCQPVAR